MAAACGCRTAASPSGGPPADARRERTDEAERFAREALAKVPNWHYVRDVLIPQIAAARRTNPTAGRRSHG